MHGQIVLRRLEYSCNVYVVGDIFLCTIVVPFTVMAAPEGSQFDARQFDAKMDEL